MATKRTGLGRGIGALIPTGDQTAGRPVDVFFPTSQQVIAEAEELIAVPGARLANLDPNEIAPNAHQPRVEFRQEELEELIVSIREIGVLQPIVVRPITDAVAGAPQYELIMGERRLRATKALGLDQHPRGDQEHRRRRHAARCPAREPAQGEPQPAGRSIRLPAVARGLWHHPGRARSANWPVTAANHQYDPSAAASIRDPEARGGRRAQCRTRPRHPLGRRATRRWRRWPPRSSTKTCPCGRQRPPLLGPRPSRRKSKPLPGGRQGQLNEIADRLGDRLNTRVKVALGSSKGSITIDFATVGDLNRILGELGEPGFN